MMCLLALPKRVGGLALDFLLGPKDPEMETYVSTTSPRTPPPPYA